MALARPPPRPAGRRAYSCLGAGTQTTTPGPTGVAAPGAPRRAVQRRAAPRRPLDPDAASAGSSSGWRSLRRRARARCELQERGVPRAALQQDEEDPQPLPRVQHGGLPHLQKAEAAHVHSRQALRCRAGRAVRDPVLRSGEARAAGAHAAAPAARAALDERLRHFGHAHEQRGRRRVGHWRALWLRGLGRVVVGATRSAQRARRAGGPSDGASAAHYLLVLAHVMKCTNHECAVPGASDQGLGDEPRALPPGRRVPLPALRARRS